MPKPTRDKESPKPYKHASNPGSLRGYRKAVKQWALGEDKKGRVTLAEATDAHR